MSGSRVMEGLLWPVRRLRGGFNLLRRKYRAFKVLTWEVRKLSRRERQWDVPLNQRRPKWWMQGFMSRSALLYDLDRSDPSLYVSDLQRMFRNKRMVHARLQEIINNKFSTHLLLSRMDVPSPVLKGIYSRGWVHHFPGQGKVPVVEYLTGMSVGEIVFFKVFAGAEGKNIYAITKLDGDRVEMNGQPTSLRMAAKVFTDQTRPFIIEAGIIQHPKMNELYPHSVNTIRALTIPDVEKNEEPYIALAVQRIGCDRSQPSDNWSRGGLSARVDLETGILSRATRLPDEDVKEWFDSHPDTGAPITGVQLPLWEETREMILRAAREVSFLEYIGWDIVIGPDGPLVLEANINTGVNVFQSHQPLLSDPKVRAYYTSRGVKLPQRRTNDATLR